MGPRPRTTPPTASAECQGPAAQSVIEGTLRLDRAHITEISLRGVQVGDGTGESLVGAGLTVDGDMECNLGFTARGQIALQGARIAGLLTFRDAVLNSARTAAVLTRLQADGLCLRTAAPIAGGIPMTGFGRSIEVG
jgi:hypothetical protein